jgi:Predicted glycosyl hydrolase
MNDNYKRSYKRNIGISNKRNEEYKDTKKRYKKYVGRGILAATENEKPKEKANIGNDEDNLKKSNYKKKNKKKTKPSVKKFRKQTNPIPIIFMIVFLIAVIPVSIMLIIRYRPTKEMADKSLLFQTEDGNVPIILDNSQSEYTAYAYDESYYLPLNFVNKELEAGFYFDREEELLLFTLPEELIVMKNSDTDDEGNNLWRLVGGEVYVLIDVVQMYTNILDVAYETIPMRIFLNTAGMQYTASTISKDTEVRLRGGIKSPVVTNVKKGDEIVVIGETADWTYAVSPDGYFGYINNKHVGDKIIQSRDSKTMPVYSNISRDFKISMGWHQVTSANANSGMEALVERTKGLNVISPTWFFLNDDEGNFSSIASKDYVDKAHELGLEVWALIDNFTNPVDTYAILSSTTNRTRLIEGIMEAINEYELDGINIDFEELQTKDGEPFVQFIRELSVECRKSGVVLSVDNPVPMSFTAHYNRKEQGKFVDYVIIMGYDEHYAGSETAGPTASIDFVKAGIENTLKEVPANKVINAIPFYTRVWYQESGAVRSEAIGLTRTNTILEEQGAEPELLGDLGLYYFEYSKNGIDYKIWIENAETLERKMEEMFVNNDLAGVAYWKLGLETTDVWDMIVPFLENQ